MNRSTLGLLGGLLLAASPAAAQSGFALKGHFVYNGAARSAVEADTLPQSNGFSVGAELVLPLGIGVGVSGYAANGTSDFDVETSSLVVLAEANYFLNLPLLPVSPYAGVHAGLGRYTRETADDLDDAEIRDDRTQLGYQLGVRVQLNSLLGLDAQYRRVSVSAAEDQDEGLDRNQYLVGVTLF